MYIKATWKKLSNYEKPNEENANPENSTNKIIIKIKR